LFIELVEGQNVKKLLTDLDKGEKGRITKILSGIERKSKKESFEVMELTGNFLPINGDLTWQ